MEKKFEIKNNGLRYGLHHDSDQGGLIKKLEKKFLATGEDQEFITHTVESDGFMEPKNVFEISCILKLREGRIGYWTGRKKQIY